MNNFLVSLITMDHINFEQDVNLVDSLGVDGLHIDIMDGHFVPRLGIYPEIVKRVSDISSLPFDLHMMVEDIDFTIDQFKHIPNIEYIHFHVESCIGNELRVIDKIKAQLQRLVPVHKVLDLGMEGTFVSRELVFAKVKCKGEKRLEALKFSFCSMVVLSMMRT